MGARAAGFALSAAPAIQDPSVVAHGWEGPGRRLVGGKEYTQDLYR